MGNPSPPFFEKIKSGDRLLITLTGTAPPSPVQTDSRTQVPKPLPCGPFLAPGVTCIVGTTLPTPDVCEHSDELKLPLQTQKTPVQEPLETSPRPWGSRVLLRHESTLRSLSLHRRHGIFALGKETRSESLLLNLPVSMEYHRL